jgi:hypothetical protein
MRIVAFDEEAAAIRAAFDRGRKFGAVAELRRLLTGISDAESHQSVNGSLASPLAIPFA